MKTVADAIVIGGGPSGVAAAIELKRGGLGKVILLDREPHLGGATRHCLHSPFGMREFGRVFIGASYGRRLEDEAAKAGVDVRLNHSVVRLDETGTLLVSHPQGVEDFEARRVVSCTGARETPRSARLLSGDRPVGVVTTGALQAHIAFHNRMPFRRPLIVGSELVTMSAVLTCLTHGARPVAVIEERDHALVGQPFALFPTLVGIPFLRKAKVVDIVGSGRVEAVKVRVGQETRLFECDGLLLTGQFTPEASLLMQSGLGVAPGSVGPEIDQFGQSRSARIYAAGNVLRAVETGGWAFREGKAIGQSLIARYHAPDRISDPVSITFDAPIKLVVPNLWRNGDGGEPAFPWFQLRMTRRAKGRLVLEVNGEATWAERGTFMPERRILAPMPAVSTPIRQIGFSFRED